MAVICQYSETFIRIDDGVDALSIQLHPVLSADKTSYTFTASVFLGGQELTDAEVTALGALVWRVGDTRIGTGKTLTRTVTVKEIIECVLDAGGGELMKTEYGILPGGEIYAKGRNLYSAKDTSEWSDWWKPGEGTNRCRTFGEFTLKDIDYIPDAPLKWQVEIEVRNATAGKIQTQSHFNGKWGSSSAYWVSTNLCSSANASLGGQVALTTLNGKVTRIYSKKEASFSKEILETKAYLDDHTGSMEPAVRIDNANPEAEIRFRRFMVSYGEELPDYSPAPEVTT